MTLGTGILPAETPGRGEDGDGETDLCGKFRRSPQPYPCSRIGRFGWIFFRNAFVVRSLSRVAGRLAHSSACERICCAATSLPTAWIRLSRFEM